jgi:hypothetical protein
LRAAVFRSVRQRNAADLHRTTDETFLIESGEVEINLAETCFVDEGVTPSIFPKEFPMRQE